MNKKNFIKILQQPEKLSKKELLFLQEISDEFPYFQPSRAIYLKSLAENEDIKFKKYLKSTAVYTRDRKILFDFIKNIQIRSFCIKPILLIKWLKLRRKIILISSPNFHLSICLLFSLHFSKL